MKRHLIFLIILFSIFPFFGNTQNLLARYDFNKVSGAFTDQSYLPTNYMAGVTFGGEFTFLNYSSSTIDKSLITNEGADCLMFKPSGLKADSGLLYINNRFHYVTVTPSTGKRVIISKAIVRYKSLIGSSVTKYIGMRCALRPNLDTLSTSPKQPYTLGFPFCNSSGVWGNYLSATSLTTVTSNTLVAKTWNPSLDYSFIKPTNLSFEFSGAVDGSNSIYIDWIEFWGDVVPISNETPTQKLYYIDPVGGDNANKGDSPESPRKDINDIHSSMLIPGTQILFKAGTTYNGTVALNDVKGTITEPITISTYWDGLPASTIPATINGTSYLSALQLEDCSYINVSKLQFSANGGGFLVPSLADQKIRCGVLVRTTKAGDNREIHLSELTVSNVYFYDPGYDASGAGETDANGFGIRFYNQIANATLKQISVKNCSVSNVGHTGIKMTGGSGNYIDSIDVENNTISQVGGPGIQIGTSRYAHFAYNKVDNSGSSNDIRMWHRGSGLWTWGVFDVLIEHNSFTNANGPGDSAGAHIDYNCTNVVMQYNFSANNAGGFVEVLGNNWNCCYRYNVSINDGWRVKGVNGAFQEGKTLWLSGYVGSAKSNGPYNTYIYNNTIYVQSSQVSKISIESTAKGLLIANNIFYILGNSASVLGDQTSTSTLVKTDEGDVYFRNNLFLKTTNWPSAEKIVDAAPMYGDPNFANGGGLKIEDYIPSNLNLIQGKGVPIPNLPGDVVGLKIGLKVTSDILGNPINEVIDMGAIAVTTVSNVTDVNKNDTKILAANGKLTITNEGTSIIALYSVMGNIIQSKPFTNSITIVCQRGIYIAKVNNKVHKVIVN
jgi:hypothetical protein